MNGCASGVLFAQSEVGHLPPHIRVVEDPLSALAQDWFDRDRRLELVLPCGDCEVASPVHGGLALIVGAYA